jgi:hypothetical protein
MSLAGGCDYGDREAVRMGEDAAFAPLSIIEQCVLADVRMYGVTLKLVAPGTATHENVGAEKLQCHFIRFMHSGPAWTAGELAAAVDIPGRLAELFRSFTVMLLGPVGSRETLANRLMNAHQMRLRAHVVYNELAVRIAVDVAQGRDPSVTLPSVEELLEAFKAVPQEIRDNMAMETDRGVEDLNAPADIAHVRDPAADPAEAAAGSDAAPMPGTDAAGAIVWSSCAVIATGIDEDTLTAESIKAVLAHAAAHPAPTGTPPAPAGRPP